MLKLPVVRFVLRIGRKFRALMASAVPVGIFAAFALAAPDAAAAGRAKSPEEATVFIRLVGSVHVEIQEFGITTTADRDRVEVGTGSGFVISPYGYVLTNAHVVSGSDVVTTDGPRTAKINVKVSTVQVCFPAGAADARGTAPSCLDASIHTSDPTLDLAVLFVGAANLPYLALGDSDTAIAGQPVTALGFPFGRRVEVGQSVTAPDLVPSVSVTPGAISAIRAGDGAQRRYLQISSAVNPGNSGGPVVDRDGFAMGVIRMGLRDASGIAFAIPINLVKEFLESRGLDQIMPARRMRLGAFQSIEGKSVGLRFPESWTDVSRFRSHVESGASGSTIALKIDRVSSPWSLADIEQILVGSQSFERLAVAAKESQTLSRSSGGSLLIGHVSGTSAVGLEEMRMDYAILDVGREKLVARYTGPADEMAFNAGILRESLNGLEGQAIIGPGLDAVDRLQWVAAAATDGVSRIPAPTGWLVEPAGPSSCAGLPAASAVMAAFSPADFTVGVRAALWPGAGFTPEVAASSCTMVRTPSASASYASRGDWLGVAYVVEGTFVRLAPDRILQLEVVAPDRKSAFARALLAAWMRVAVSGMTP